jgi:uncharacterized protein with gpF-like domain
MYRQVYNAYRKRYRVLIKRELDKQCMALLKGEQPDEEKLKQYIRKLHNGAGITMAKYNYDKIRKSAGVKDSMTPEQRWAAVIKLFLEQGLTQLVNGITSTTKETIRKVLIQGMQEGWNIMQMMKEIEKSGINIYRAELIARTETTRAANQGAMLGAISTGLQTMKEWIAITDDRTRRIPRNDYDHLHMDGKTTPIDQPFTVPGLRSIDIMEFPGDPNGSAGNVCNCRCTVGFEVVRDSNGKPVDIQGGLRGPAGDMLRLWNNTLFLQLQTLINEALPS